MLRWLFMKIPFIAGDFSMSDGFLSFAWLFVPSKDSMQKELLSLKSFVLKFCWNPSLMFDNASFFAQLFDSCVFYGGEGDKSDRTQSQRRTGSFLVHHILITTHYCSSCSGDLGPPGIPSSYWARARLAVTGRWAANRSGALTPVTNKRLRVLLVGNLAQLLVLSCRV